MNNEHSQYGFSLVELMVAILLGLLISYTVLQIYLAQTQIYKTSNSQGLILNTENAITNLVSPVIRDAGFVGCSTVSTAISNLNAGGSDPLGSFNTTPSMVRGYNGSGASFTIAQSNPANDTTATHWNPTLAAGLVGQVQQGNDVLVVLGADPNSQPSAITAIDASSNNFTIQSNAHSNAIAGGYGAISDCVKSMIFQVSSVGSSVITHNAGMGTLQNTTSTFPISFQIGSQFIPLQQTAFFVGQGQGGQSSLMRGILNGSAWTIEPIVPGVEFMKVQYGIGTNGAVTRYVSANTVTDWSEIYAIRIGFLIAGQLASGSLTQQQYTVLDTVVNAPADNRLRHVFELTIQLRNAL